MRYRIFLLVSLAGLAGSGCQPATAQAETVLDRSPEQVTLPELWQEYRAWRDAGDLERAHAVALRLSQREAAVHGDDSARHGQALAELGATEVLLERYEEAIDHLDRAEALLIDDRPLYSEDLIVPMTFMGVALQAAGRYQQALGGFARARHISHRLWGTNNLTQIPIVYAEAQSHQALGDLHQAEQLHRLAHELLAEHRGLDHPETLQAAARLGTWLRSVGDYNGSIAWFHQALDELMPDGIDRPEAYPLLYGLAHAYRGGFRGRFARSVYERMLELMARHPEDFDPGDQVRIRVEFGDWLMQRFYEPKAVDLYRSAWRLAQEAELQDWIDWLAEPVMVRYGGMAPVDYDDGDRYLDFEFDLTDDGRPRKVEVTDHGTGGRERAEARKLFPKTVRFRPPIVDGEAVALADQTITLYLLPPGTTLEPPSVAPPGRLTPVAGGLGPDLRTLSIDDVRKPVGIDQ